MVRQDASLPKRPIHHQVNCGRTHPSDVERECRSLGDDQRHFNGDRGGIGVKAEPDSVAGLGCDRGPEGLVTEIHRTVRQPQGLQPFATHPEGQCSFEVVSED